MRKHLRFNLSVLPAVAVFAFVFRLPTGITFAADALPAIQIDHVTVGFDGYFKVGRFAPVSVVFSTSGPGRIQLIVETVDPDGCRVELPAEEFSVDAAGSHRREFFFKSGRIDGPLEVRLLDDSGNRAVHVVHVVRIGAETNEGASKPLRQSERLVATWGLPADVFSKLYAANRPKDRKSARAMRIVDVGSSGYLPMTAEAYDSLDTLVIAGRYSLGDVQNQALKKWVRSGGHVVISIGAETSEFQNSLLAKWVPGKVVGQLSLRQLSELESLLAQNVRIPISRPVPVAQFEVEGGIIEASRFENSLLARVPLGFGEVTFLAIDLDRPPLSTWRAFPRLFQKIALSESRRLSESQPDQLRLSGSGITDLATQLRGSVGYFPEIKRRSSWTIIGLMFLYLFLVGPLDYGVTRYVLKNPRLTWVTFPVLVVVCAFLAFLTAGNVNGDRLLLNQLDVIDVDESLDLVRTHTWMTLYTPEAQRYRVDARPSGFASSAERGDSGVSASAQADLPLMSWSGVPESTFGGIYRPSGIEFGHPAYRFSTRSTAIENIPIPIWSTKTLTTTWQSDDRTLIESKLESTGSRHLRGTISHKFSVPIRNWLLVYGNRVYRPAPTRPNLQEPVLPRNVAWSPAARDVIPKDLNSYLTGATETKVKSKRPGQDEEILVRKVKYNPFGRNAANILRMITFHEKAGSRDYTGLTNYALKSFEFSRLLDLKRAILFARIDLPATEIELNGKKTEPTRHTAFLRAVLPVKQVGIRFEDVSKLGK